MGLTGCTNGGMGTISWPNMPGKPGEYTCEDVGVSWQSYCNTGEYPQLCDCG